MPVGLGPRFLIEAGFLIAVAVGAGIARLGTATIIAVMAGAWLIVAAVEWVVARARARMQRAEPVEAPRSAWPEPVVRHVEPAPPAPEPVVDEQREPEPEPAPEPAVTPGPSPEPAPVPERERPSEPAPPETPPAQPRVAAVPPPATEPQPVLTPTPVAPQPVPAATQATVVPIAAGARRPGEWNLWELERIAREQSGSDAARDEERSFLLMYLREFADADGVLPASFDAIVRESFGDVLSAAHT